MKHLQWVLVCALLIIIQPLSATAAPQLANARPGELILKLHLGTTLDPAANAGGLDSSELQSALRAVGAVSAESLGTGSQTYRLRLAAPGDLLRLAGRLRASSAVEYAEPNYTRALMRIPNDSVLDQQWALHNIHAFEAWDITTGSNITVAVLDTGVSRSHPDLKGQLLQGYDFANGDDDPSDDEGHGTYTAGVVAAKGDNGTGIAGICWGCKVLPVKVLNRRGQGDDAGIAQGIRWSVDQGARIISMSLGGTEDTPVIRDAVAYARDHNVLLIAASGNGQEDGNQPNYPAAYPGVLAVSATGPSDQVTGFSTTGDYVGIAAPGVGVWSTLWDSEEGNTYGAANGTSAACPHVAGAAALVLTIRPDLSAAQLAEILEASADDEGPAGKDAQEGYGRLNLLRAVQMASDPNVLSQSRIQGHVSGVPAGATVSLSSGQQAALDGSGNYSFSGLPAGTYTVGVGGAGFDVQPKQVWLSGTALSVANVDFLLGPDASQYFQAVAQPTDGATYFPQTGHTLRSTFKSYWQANGGLPIFGYPISEEFVERGDGGQEYVVQYFERYRFELHPENAAPYNVLLSRLGNTLLELNSRDWFSFPKGQPTSGCRYFEATGHSLCEPFLSYWRAHGLEFDGRRGTSEAESLALFGQPLSEPQLETSSDGQQYVTQWFERARFEDHGSQGVLLGLLSSELATLRGWRH